VFWSQYVNSALTAPTTGIAQFLADVGSTGFFNVLSEYSTFGITDGTDQYIGNGNSTVNSYTLVPSTCAGTSACALTDAQIQTELNAQITAGNLPQPTYDAAGNANTVYMTYFPPNVTVSGPDGSGDSCVQFCAYHNTGTVSGSGDPLVYGVLMDEFTTACAEGCGGNATAMENMTDTSSHELAESITDADIGLDTGNNYAYPAAWGDNNNNCGEIGDICDSGSAGDTITVGGRTWSVQELWSNKLRECISTESATFPPFALSSPGNVTAGTPFNVTLTVQNLGGTAYTGYTGTVQITSSDPSAVLPAAYTFTSSDGGVHTFQATLKTGTSQTITATDVSHANLTATNGVSITQPSSPATLTTPQPGTALTTSSVAFTWTAGSGVTEYELWIGTKGAGSSNIFYPGVTTGTTETVSGLPTNGETLYVRLYSKIAGVWHSNDYTYTASSAGGLAVLTSPTTGSALTGSSVAFTWTAGTGATEYELWVGSAGAGSGNIHYPGVTTGTTETVSGLPTNGETLYVRLYSKIAGVWQYNDYTYTAEPLGVLTTPAPGSTLTSTSSTFTWKAGVGASEYELWVGTTGVGSSGLNYPGLTTSTTETVSDLPATGGGTVYVRLWTKINGVWNYNDYTYIAE